VRGTLDKPTKVGRVLDDVTTQLYRYAYNPAGHATNSVDPVGRTMTYVYSTNGVDLLEVRQTTGGQNDLVARIAYNAQHRPVLSTDAAGQTTTNTFNTSGQLLSTTNPRGETRSYLYDPDGYLLRIDGPLAGTNDASLFTYDGYGRLRTMADPDGYALTLDYDALDRLTSVTYPDGTADSYAYDKLDRAVFRDRMGRETRYVFNADRQLTTKVDPLQRTNLFEYCGCGELSAIVDALGRVTRWRQDVQGRRIEKENADGSKITYTYETTTSRLKSMCDEKSQLKYYEYFADDKPKRVSYPNAIVSTPTVSFTYDTNYARLRTIQDGIGSTTYEYHLAGLLGALRTASVDGPWPNDTVTYQYDQLGRVRTRAIGGSAQTYAHDVLGRITNMVNALGAFAYSYDGLSGRVSGVLFPNQQTSHYDYYDNVGDRRLKEIRHQKPDVSLLSRFTYGYDSVGNILSWVQEQGGSTQAWAASYDGANQLTGVNSTANGTTAKTYAYGYDPAGNRLFEELDGVRRSFSHNALNELVTGFDVGANPVTFEWDAENRLTAVNKGTHRTELAYDSQGRRSIIIEKESGGLQSERHFMWDDLRILEERNPMDGSVQSYFPHGSKNLASGINFWTQDHLGSVREVSDSTGQVLSRSFYEPYGQGTVSSGAVPGFAFAGYLPHTPSGLYLAVFRAYDPRTARWLSRDPIVEAGGANLFKYAGNNPISQIDLLGLQNYYGNYCGPGGSGVPIDGLDSACKRHDECYVSCGAAGPGGVYLGGTCVRACDRLLCWQAIRAYCGNSTCTCAKSLIVSIFCFTQGRPTDAVW
jgi:RHS repeat-associated protein